MPVIVMSLKYLGYKLLSIDADRQYVKVVTETGIKSMSFKEVNRQRQLVNVC